MQEHDGCVYNTTRALPHFVTITEYLNKIIKVDGYEVGVWWHHQVCH